MSNQTKRVILCLIFVALLSFQGCANVAPSVQKEAEVEIWQIELTGQTIGNLEMTLQRVAIQKGVFSVSGQMAGKIDDFLCGVGNADYKYEGTIKNGVFNIRIHGISEVAVGISRTNGILQANLSTSKGSGTWRLQHELGSSSGHCTMKRLGMEGN